MIISTSSMILYGIPCAPIERLAAYVESVALILADEAERALEVRFLGNGPAQSGEVGAYLDAGAFAVVPLLHGLVGMSGSVPFAANEVKRLDTTVLQLPRLQFEAALDDVSHVVSRVSELVALPISASSLRYARLAHRLFRAEADRFLHPFAFFDSLASKRRVHLALNSTLTTHASSDGKLVLLSGWYNSEDWGTWSRDHHATLVFEVSADQTYQLQCRCMLASGLDFVVTVNDVAVRHTLRNDPETVIGVPIEIDRRGGQNTTVVVSFDIRNPKRATADDDRMIGIGLKSIELTAAPAACDLNWTDGNAPPSSYLLDPPNMPFDDVPSSFRLVAPATFIAFGAAGPGVAAALAAPCSTMIVVDAGSGVRQAICGDGQSIQYTTHSGGPLPAILAAHRDSSGPSCVVVAEAAADVVRGSLTEALMATEFQSATLVGREPSRDAMRDVIQALAPTLHARGFTVVIEGLWWKALPAEPTE